MTKLFSANVVTRNDTREFKQELIITHRGNVIARESDGGEPEDNLFGRDWYWVAPLLEEVYQLGVQDGIAENLK